jgi:phosphatidylinositol kinase/protein kinase (PI-3  family)
MDYPNAKFLIYNRWEADRVAGSLLLDYAFTEEEAKEKIHLYKTISDYFNAKFPLLSDKTKSCFIYITNRPEWWSGTIQ